MMEVRSPAPLVKFLILTLSVTPCTSFTYPPRASYPQTGGYGNKGTQLQQQMPIGFLYPNLLKNLNSGYNWQALQQALQQRQYAGQQQQQQQYLDRLLQTLYGTSHTGQEEEAGQQTQTYEDIEDLQEAITSVLDAVYGHSSRTFAPDSSNEDDDSEENEETTTTTTTTAAPTASANTGPNMCDGCELRHGVGYKPHPSDCTLYVQCQADKNGLPVVAGVRPCPHGLYWNQDKLTCDYRHNVNCVDDICRAGAVRKTKASAASCRGYWDCNSGTALAKCCPINYSYNPYIASCTFNPTCRDDCLTSTAPFVAECPNGMRPVPGDRTKYEVKTGNTWTLMSCPANLGFSTLPCGCNVHLNTNVQQECVPELYLPFISDTQDQSGRQVFVKNEGVQVRDGKAFFDGKSRLTVPRFSNTWWGSTVYVHLRYKSALTSTRRLALVSNGDCQVRPSLAVCAGPAGVEFYAETENSPQPVNFTVSTFDQGYGWQDGWQDVLYRLDAGSLYGHVSLNRDSRVALGNLEVRQRGLVIGSGGGCDDFNGFIDEVRIS
ncbi:hypothetical protein C0Q70_04492 [Pomacea canaliculata]|uniref:Chitin-binding type-2 domain-containing protein n=1 Tax=Pomacea canaliculata TaxID=400727 RepID=A0A2T7PII8_POMCA|nr:hypothetical protein C0Q70_04492 [Pomacea canaliculata]